MAKLWDFQCVECDHRFEFLFVRQDEECMVLDCPNCSSVAARCIGSAAPPITIVRGNSDFAVREKERLTKRSHDHWRTKGRDEAIARARAKGLV